MLQPCSKLILMNATYTRERYEELQEQKRKEQLQEEAAKQRFEAGLPDLILSNFFVFNSKKCTIE